VSQFPLDEYIDNTKTQSLNFESKTHEAQLEDQKPNKNLRRSSRRGKSRKTNKRHEKQQNQAEWQRRDKKTSKLPLTVSMQPLPLR
jgi:hypothetical protein